MSRCGCELQQSDTKKLLNDEQRSKEEIVEKHNVLHIFCYFSLTGLHDYSHSYQKYISLFLWDSFYANAKKYEATLEWYITGTLFRA